MDEIRKATLLKQYKNKKIKYPIELVVFLLGDKWKFIILCKLLKGTKRFGELFMILNTRLLNKKKTIISTNFSLSKLAETYTERISSRIFDKFTLVKFVGKDLRWESKFD